MSKRRAGNTVALGEPAAQRSRYSGKAMTITIGKGGLHQVTVSEHLINSDATFFQKEIQIADAKHEAAKSFLASLLRGEKARPPLTIDRPDDERVVVEAHVEWLHSPNSALHSHGLDVLAKMYLFGEATASSGFRNATIARMRTLSDRGELPEVATVNATFSKASNDSPIRQFMVEAWVRNGTRELLRASKGNKKARVDFKDALLDAMYDALVLRRGGA